MAYSIAQNLAEAKLLAQVNVQDAFKQDVHNVINFLSKKTIEHLTDYFLLVNDLKAAKEDVRKGYSDYSFVVFPVHKAFECYVSKFLSGLINVKISHKPSESIGHYLALSDSDKNKYIEDLINRFPDFSKVINKGKWLDTLNGLNREWRENRNRLSHSDGEEILTLRQAEQAANSILREIDLSGQLIAREFYNPLVDYVKAQKKKNEGKSNSDSS